jgi:hypothetical protein
LLAATAAGIPALITVNDYTAKEQFDGAVAVLSDLGEPGAPFKVISGEAYDSGFVDVDLIRRWSAS